MVIKENPDLEDALDGLFHASHYADEIGEHDLAYRIAKLYQELAIKSPEEDWDKKTSSQEVWSRNPLDEE